MTRVSLNAVLLLGILLAAASRVPGQGTLLHGADSVLATRDAVIVWGVLRTADESEAAVVIRIVAPRFGAVSVDALDPFSGVRQSVAPPRALTGQTDIRRRRSAFDEFPRLEIHFHRAVVAGPAELTVYYLGVPDTTPEFTGEPALLRYLAESAARAGGAVERR